MSNCPTHGRFAPRKKTVAPSRVTSALMTTTASANGTPQVAVRRSSRPSPAASAASASTASTAISTAGCSQTSGTEPSAQAPEAADAGPGGVQRAAASVAWSAVAAPLALPPCVPALAPHGHGVSSGSGMPLPASIASAKWKRRPSSVSVAAAAATPTSSVPVISQVGGYSW